MKIDPKKTLLKITRNKARLKKIYSRSLPVEFTKMIWSVDAIQSGRASAAKPFITYPPQAVTSEPGDGYFALKWRLETIYNDYLDTWSGFRKGPRTLNCTHFDAFKSIYNIYHEIDDLEVPSLETESDLFDQFPRYAYQQFEWNSGMLNAAKLARSSYVYNGSHCSSHFKSANGISIERFAFCAFAIMAVFQKFPFLRLPLKSPTAEADDNDFKLTLDLISSPFGALRRRAKALRSVDGSIASRPSILRESPCVIFNNPNVLYCPLPSLIFNRLSSGLFYDVIKFGGDARREIGKRFEEYCFKIVSFALSEHTCTREFPYTVEQQKFMSPDLLLEKGGVSHVVVECKATKMSHSTVYGREKFSKGHRGFEELAKGVFQVWRYFEHARTDGSETPPVDEKAIGLILTLDPWLAMSRGRYESLLSRAEELAQKNGLSSFPRPPIAFASSEDLETVLESAGENGLFEVIKMLAGPELAGWSVHSLVEKMDTPAARTKLPLLEIVHQEFPQFANIGPSDGEPNLTSKK